MRIVLVLVLALACLGDSCGHGKFGIVEFRHVHIGACTQASNNWNGDIWIMSPETGSRGSRFRWVDSDQPICATWNENTYWDIILRAYQRKNADSGELYEAYDVMLMRKSE